MIYNEFQVGDTVKIRDLASVRNGMVGSISHVGNYAYWVRTEDGIDLPVWSVERVAEDDIATKS